LIILMDEIVKRPQTRYKTLIMIRKLVVRTIFCAALLGVLSGCTSVTNYSLRSYQGPLPLDDYRFVDVHTYGSPVTGR
jgi:hypothetical protein